MEPLQLQMKPRKAVEVEIESWDDDDFVLDGDELNLRSPTTTSSMSVSHLRRRDSTSSHMSLRSDLDSWQGEEQHVHLPGDDERSTMAAIAAAESAGIPIPKNIPSSALTGGTIKRLGGRKIRRIIQEDWENDMDFPEPSQAFQMKVMEQSEFPDSIRQASGDSVPTSPRGPNMLAAPLAGQDDRRSSIASNASAFSSTLGLDDFNVTTGVNVNAHATANANANADAQDNDNDGNAVANASGVFGLGGSITIGKNRLASRPIPLVTPPSPRKTDKAEAIRAETEVAIEVEAEDDFEKDLELPFDGKLKLVTRRDIPRASMSQSDELDWGEGSSLGTRYGGTGRDGRSARSSSVSALSPSISSTFTVESEDENLDGLVLPPGPVNFHERLQHRKKSPQPDLEAIPDEPRGRSSPKPTAPVEADQKDFLEGLEIGDGDLFKLGKRTIHKNVKIKESTPASPARPKTAVSLTFTNKPILPQTRIPRLNHDRAHSTALEPVSESGGPIPQRFRRAQSRLSHSAQSSVSSLPTPTTPLPPPIPRRTEISTRSSMTSLRNEPSTTTSAQLLRQKRSLPGARTMASPGKTTLSSRPERPPSRADSSSRPNSGLRPKTPVERHQSSAESPQRTRRPPVPFLPAGASQLQSQHVSSRTTTTTRTFRRHDSDNLDVRRPVSRSLSRSRAGLRSPSPFRFKASSDKWERLSRPKNRKHFGDGHELDGFDDLPTSKESESRFLRQPVSGGAPGTVQRRGQQTPHPDRMQTPLPRSPQMTRMYPTPSFARDTASSRIARETSLAHRTPSGGHLATVSAQRAVPVPARGIRAAQPPPVPQKTIRSKKPSKRPPQLKPHLIANLNSDKESRVVSGMFYNAETYRWEGNENALNAFDAGASTPSTTSMACHQAREREAAAATPRPALITNFSATKGVQVVGGMVFDPHNMCWLKLGPQNGAKSEVAESIDDFNTVEEEEDVFEGIPDLEENTNAAEEERGERPSDVKDDWLIGEEFDVGPEFIRRQREEEERWRKRCEKWIGRGARDHDTWRWTIRELVSQFDQLPMSKMDSP